MNDEVADRVLTPAALDFVADLHRTFDTRRRELLRQRELVQTRLDRGEGLAFLVETRSVRDGAWQVPPAPADLQDRRVEITGPVDRKMIINALNSGAQVYMADFEDATAPTFQNIIGGLLNLEDAILGQIEHTDETGRRYRLREQTATLVVRPRGLHLPERHLQVDGQPVAGAFFDFGLFFFQNARRLLERGSGPYFYLPKLESHLEARLWAEVFDRAEQVLSLPHGVTRATVLIETLPAAFEMDEILFELRDHATGLNAGRWDYIFSAIKKLRAHGLSLPDRAQITMDVPFMRAYTDLLVQTCHRRGAHAIGGMAAFIPSRRDPKVNEIALARVTEDKERESKAGFDGTWVAHPDLVQVARGVFDRTLGGRLNQLEQRREEVRVSAADLLGFKVEGGRVTEAGVRSNIAVALLYLDSWLQGTGAVAIHNLMEDAATAEIARSQLWHWRTHEAQIEDAGPLAGLPLCNERLRGLFAGELGRLQAEAPKINKLDEAAKILERLVFSEHFTDFFTTNAYEHLP